MLHIQPVAAPRRAARALELGFPDPGQPRTIPTGSGSAPSASGGATTGGQSWTAVSGDLTTRAEPLRVAVSTTGCGVWDALHDTAAMSRYATLTAISESPVAAGVLYAGSATTASSTAAVTAAGPGSRRRSCPDCRRSPFINDVEASQHDPDAVFVVADNHKNGRLPAVSLREQGTGARAGPRSAANPARGSHPVGDPAGPSGARSPVSWERRTGCTPPGTGEVHWVRLKGAPTDLLPRPENCIGGDDDLVGATFGRGLLHSGRLRPAPGSRRSGRGGGVPPCSRRGTPGGTSLRCRRRRPAARPRGARLMSPTNPPFGAVLTYFLTEDLQTARGGAPRPGEAGPRTGRRTSRSPASTPCARRAWRRLRRSSW